MWTPLLVTMCVGYFLILLDVTIVNVALPRIGQQLRVGGGPLAWVTTGYTVPFAALLLFAGTTGDRLGHRRMVLTGLAVFGLASLACSVAPTLGVLVGGRAVQGVGAAFLLPGTLAVITKAIPDPALRARAVGVWASVGGLALIAGPLLGGLLVSTVGWPSVFWINLPVVAAALVAAVRVLPHEAGDPRTRPDSPGAALGAVFLAAVVFAAAEHSWLAAVLAVVTLGAFLLVERSSGQPMLPLVLFGRRDFALFNLGAFIMNAAGQGMLFLVALMLQDAQGHGPLQAGLAMLPGFVPLAVLPSFAGGIINRFGAGRVAAVSLMVTALGIAGLTLVGKDTPYLAMVMPLLVWGAGLGLLTPALVGGAVSAVSADRSGLASAVNNTARQAGGSLGTAVCAALAGPVLAAGFVSGFRLAAVIMAGLCAAVAVLLLIGVGRSRTAPG
ncbi:MAG: MFS transporter [Kutzneria sp.]|nr:MFS transporter [Kutzneria sp.]MBV9845356.1 MFS transporter [Kutzneria sp.]